MRRLLFAFCGRSQILGREFDSGVNLWQGVQRMFHRYLLLLCHVNRYVVKVMAALLAERFIGARNMT